MENNTLNELMSEFETKLDLTKIPEMSKLKGRNPKNSMRYFFYRTCFELLVGIFTIWFLGNLLLNNLNSPSLIISSSIIIAFAGVITFGSIRQMIIISQFDVNGDVVTNQSILAALQTRFLFYLRISMMQIPLFLAYIVLGFAIFLNVDIWVHGDETWLFANIILGALLIPPVIWLIAKLTPANVEVPWVRKFISLAGGDHLVQTMEYIEQIKSFKAN